MTLKQTISYLLVSASLVIAGCGGGSDSGGGAATAEEAAKANDCVVHTVDNKLVSITNKCAFKINWEMTLAPLVIGGSLRSGVSTTREYGGTSARPEDIRVYACQVPFRPRYNIQADSVSCVR